MKKFARLYLFMKWSVVYDFFYNQPISIISPIEKIYLQDTDQS